MLVEANDEIENLAPELKTSSFPMRKISPGKRAGSICRAIPLAHQSNQGACNSSSKTTKNFWRAKYLISASLSAASEANDSATRK